MLITVVVFIAILSVLVLVHEFGHFLVAKKLKIKVEDVADKLIKGEKAVNLGFKPFFRLHPPRKGIESKKHFGVGKGVLGDNGKEINKLITRML